MSKGNIDYTIPEIVLSEDRIELELEDGAEAKGDFTISSKNSLEIKGLVYSESESVIIYTDQFSGRKALIRYGVNVKNAVPGEVISGNINIVSNGGAIALPFRITVREKSIATSDGPVKDLDDFARLAAQNYEEAYRIFFSEKFKSGILWNDMRGCSIYDGLTKNHNRELAMEEFLVACGRKYPVTVTLEEWAASFDDIEENVSGIVKIKKSGWGYIDIKVDVKGDFLYNCRENVTLDNFAGNSYEYEYLINKAKLHPGMNTALITFRTYAGDLEFGINVRMPREDEGESPAIAEKRYTSALMREYLDFRTEKISANRWLAETERMVDERLEIFPRDYVSRLLKAQLMLQSGRDDAAAEIIKDAGEAIMPNREAAIEIYCYYLYIKTLQKGNDTFTSGIKNEIRGYYENGCDSWELLWILLYIDPAYQQNLSLRYATIKEHASDSHTSPMLYFEAIKALNEKPELLRVLNRFELRLMCFGCRYGCIGKKLKDQFIAVFTANRSPGSLMPKILRGLYDIYPDDDVLEAICRMLIRDNRCGSEDFKWYEEAVKRGLNITRLYEFYIYSIDKSFTGELLPAIYMYFGYSTDTIPMQKDFLFSNVIRNKENRPSTYESYKDEILSYALTKLSEGEINGFLKVIYEDVISIQNINEQNARAAASVYLAYEISTDNEKMREVSVAHKESMEPVTVRISEGKAYASVYTRDPVIIFTDFYGNRYCGGVGFKAERLLSDDEVLDKCFALDPGNELLLLHYAERHLEKGEKDEAIALFASLAGSESLGGIYKRNLVSDVIGYYRERHDGIELDECIRRVNMEKIEPAARNEIIDILALRGESDEVLSRIAKYGYEGVAPEYLAIFCDKRAGELEFAEDKPLVRMTFYAFKNGEYTAGTLKYLSMWFRGTSSEMLSVWRECLGNDELSLNRLMEDIIAQLLFERNTDDLGDILCEYVQTGRNKTIKAAALSLFAYEFFINKRDVPGRVFDIMEGELISRYDLPDICRMAFLKFHCDDASISKGTLKVCERVMRILGDEGVNFEFFKKYNRFFDVPANLLDKSVFDLSAPPSCRVSMKYRIERGGIKTEQRWEITEMGQTYPGVFVKELPLFFGDRIEYSFIVTEGIEEDESKLKSYVPDDETIYDPESRFGMINTMIVCRKTGRTSALTQLAKTYTLNRRAADELFKIL